MPESTPLTEGRCKKHGPLLFAVGFLARSRRVMIPPDRTVAQMHQSCMYRDLGYASEMGGEEWKCDKQVDKISMFLSELGSFLARDFDSDKVPCICPMHDGGTEKIPEVGSVLASLTVSN